MCPAYLALCQYFLSSAYTIIFKDILENGAFLDLIWSSS